MAKIHVDIMHPQNKPVLWTENSELHQSIQDLHLSHDIGEVQGSRRQPFSVAIKNTAVVLAF